MQTLRLILAGIVIFGCCGWIGQGGSTPSPPIIPQSGFYLAYDAGTNVIFQSGTYVRLR